MERPPLGPGSRPNLLAPPSRTARALEMHVEDQPAATVRADDVDRQHLIAIGTLQLDAIGPQLVMPRDEQRPFNDPVAGVVEVFLDHRDALAEHAGVHAVGEGATLGAPQLPHPFLIVGLDCGEKLRDRFVDRLRHRRTSAGTTSAGGAAGKQQQGYRDPSLHETSPVVGVTRR
jgi:hypothetical protein